MADGENRYSKVYGAAFPGNIRTADGPALEKWVSECIRHQRDEVTTRRLHYSRNRLFRTGKQWIATRDGVSWKQPRERENKVRITENMLGPALDFRKDVLFEQRPGFKHMVMGRSSMLEKELAEGQQAIAEFYYHTLKVWLIAELAYENAQTDAVAFLHTFVDRRRGKGRPNVRLVQEGGERYEELAQLGYENIEGTLMIPLNADDEDLQPGEEPSKVMGDVNTRMVLAHECWCDPEALTINGPLDPCKWFFIRRLISLEEARLIDPTVEPSVEGASEDDHYDSPMLVSKEDWKGGVPPFPDRVRKFKNAVFETIAFLAPSDVLPDGYTFHLVGNKRVDVEGDGTLPGRLIPITPIYDNGLKMGIFPRPQMTDWLPDQVAINALLSAIITQVKNTSGVALLARKGTVLSESLNTIFGALFSYDAGPAPTPLRLPRVSTDAWQLLQLLIRQLENKTGHNDLARGQLTGSGGASMQDISGRAVLGAKEMLERTFGGPVRGIAHSMSEWSRIVVAYATWLHEDDIPALVARTGRLDLARQLDAAKLQEEQRIYVDPQTMMPMPTSLRNQLLVDMLDKQLISPAEFGKRSPFAEIQDLQLGSPQQVERAQLVNTLLEGSFRELTLEDRFNDKKGLGIWYQDDPQVHMEVLEEIILDTRRDPKLKKICADRWGVYAELMKHKVSLQTPVDPSMPAPPPVPVPFEVLGVPLTVPIAEQPVASNDSVLQPPPFTSSDPSLSPTLPNPGLAG